MEKPKLLCVVGPTASGKTDFAIELCKERGGEVVSCDSMQIYRGMDIGTAKPTKEEMQGIAHHMLDVVEPATNYSVADFVTDARACITDILNRGKLPVLCGGTGLYVDSLLHQIEFAPMPRDDAFREEMRALANREGNEALHQRLKALDPEAAGAIHPNNVKRVIRALEMIEIGKMTKTQSDRLSKKTPVYDAEIYGLSMPRERLYERINLRVDRMMERGLLSEVENLLRRGVPEDVTSMQAIGYKDLIAHIKGELSLQEAVDSIKLHSRRYAKRQMTWFRRNPEITWISR